MEGGLGNETNNHCVKVEPDEDLISYAIPCSASVKQEYVDIVLDRCDETENSTVFDTECRKDTNIQQNVYFLKCATLLKCENDKAFFYDDLNEVQVQNNQGHLKISDRSVNSSNRSGLLSETYVSTDHEGSKNLPIFPCQECQRNFSRSRNLKRHIESVHRRIKKHVCGDCQRAFSRHEYLKNHMEDVHENTRKYKCNDCERSFTRKVNLNTHIQRDHTGRDLKRKTKKKYMCNECQRAYCRRDYLEAHVEFVHKQSKNFTCPECERCFLRNDDMKKHIEAVHKHVKNFTCEQCQRKFSRKLNLTMHIESIHRHLKKFFCNHCPQMFTRKHSLMTHVECIHLNVKKFICQVCQEKFSRKRHMKKHVEYAHTKLNEANDIKPFVKAYLKELYKLSS